MLKFAPLLAMAAIASASTPDLDGTWNGRLRTPDGSAVERVTLIISQMGEHLSGSFLFGRTGASVPFTSSLQNGGFVFQVRDASGHAVTFRLAVSDSGIGGEATAGDVVRIATFPESEHSASRVTEKTTAPVLIRKAEPEYTPEARQARVQGTVMLHTVIDESGRATDLYVIHGLGMGLDEKAIECVQKWQFKPGLGLDGKPRSTEATIEVNFRL